MNTNDAALTAPSTTPPTTATSGSRPVLGFCLDALIAVVVMLVVSIACGIAWAVAQGIRAGMHGIAAADAGAAIGQPGAIALLWMALLSTGSAALVVYFWRRRASAAERSASWAAAQRPATWGWTLLVALVVTVSSNGAEWLAAQAAIDVVPTNLALVKTGLAEYPWFLVVFVVLLAPAYEELLFRRVLFGRLWAAGRPWLGLLLSSVLFALMHEIPGLTGNTPAAVCLLWLVYGAMGAAFAWLYWRTGTLWAPIAAHALTNSFAVLMLAAGVSPT